MWNVLHSVAATHLIVLVTWMAMTDESNTGPFCALTIVCPHYFVFSAFVSCHSAVFFWATSSKPEAVWLYRSGIRVLIWLSQMVAIMSAYDDSWPVKLAKTISCDSILGLNLTSAMNSLGGLRQEMLSQPMCSSYNVGIVTLILQNGCVIVK